LDPRTLTVSLVYDHAFFLCDVAPENPFPVSETPLHVLSNSVGFWNPGVPVPSSGHFLLFRSTRDLSQVRVGLVAAAFWWRTVFFKPGCPGSPTTGHAFSLSRVYEIVFRSFVPPPFMTLAFSFMVP